MCLSFIMAAFGLVALVKGEIKVTKNRQITGAVGRILGLLLLAGAAAPFLVEGGAVISIGILLFTILVGLLGAKPIGTQIRQSEHVAVPAGQSSSSLSYSPSYSYYQSRLGEPVRNESSRVRPVLFFLVCVALLVAVLLYVAGKSANGLLLTNQTPSSNVTTTKPSESANRLIVAQDGTLQISVPNDWQEVDDLNAAAKLQVGSGHRDAFLIVIAENKVDFESFKTYAKLVASNNIARMGASEVKGPTNLTINGNKAIQYTVSATINGVKATYLYTIIEGQSYYVQVISWTASSRFSDFEALLQRIVLSLEEGSH